MSASNRKRRPWERQERHYCQYCNAWMGSDRSSVLLHENGQKHKAAVERYLQDKRSTKLDQDRAASLVQRSLAQMEAAAQQAQAIDESYFYNAAPTAPPLPPSAFAGSVSSAVVAPTFAPPHAGASSSVPPPPLLPPLPPVSSSDSGHKKPWKDWEDRKRHRRDENERTGRKGNGNEAERNADDELELPQKPDSEVSRRIKGDPDYGHYETSGVSNQVWLEGDAFGSSIIEKDMPVQLWMGSALASQAEKRLPERDRHWKDALVVAIRKTRIDEQQQQNQQEMSLAAAPGLTLVVDVAYLESPDSEQETLVKSVPLDRIRILLANPRDDRIPETLEEARLIALGGEEVVEEAAAGISMDEATGLSSWTTVSVKKFTVRQERKEERERERQKVRQAAREAQKEAKRAEERKMEEAKVANADDSALGAYDVWNRGSTEGYKGVDIHGEAKVEVHELGKKLAEKGAPVGFRKLAFKSKAAKKQNRRTTSADD